MADEVLSQAEVESLLSAMETSGTRSAGRAAQPIRGSTGRLAREDHALRLQTPGTRRQGADAGPAVAARRVSDAISAPRSPALLRSIVEVKLTSVDQLTYSEFVFSLENPTCFNLLTAEPLEGNLILDINPSILYPIIDRLLGGGKETRSAGPPAADRNRTAAGVAASPTCSWTN